MILFELLLLMMLTLLLPKMHYSTFILIFDSLQDRIGNSITNAE